MKPKLTEINTSMWSLCVILALTCLCSASSKVQAADYNGNALINVHLDPQTSFIVVDPLNDIELDWSEWSGGVDCGDIEDDRCHEYLNDYPSCQFGADLVSDIQLVGPESAAPTKIMWVCAVFPDTTCVDVKRVLFSISHVTTADLLLIDYGVPDDATVTIDRDFPDFETAFDITFDTPRTNHVVPVMWIAVLPNRSGHVFFDPMNIFDSNNNEVLTSSLLTPTAGFGMDGYNPTWPGGLPIERACCNPATGECTISSIADCSAAGSDWMGDETACDPNPCPEPPTAACCEAEFCYVATEYDCGGEWLADVDDCNPNPCIIIRACCFDSGECILLSENACTGDWYGDDETCDPNPCPQPPEYACCYPDGSCMITLLEDCDGDWYTGDETCDPNPCDQPPPVRVCCYPDGSCTVSTQVDCDASQGDWYGALEDCGAINNPCPLPPSSAACCDADGSCLMLTLTDCSLRGGVWYDQDHCQANPCPSLAPCCLPDGRCFMMRDFTCDYNGGIWKSGYNSCDEVVCIQPPAPTAVCCYDATLEHPGSCLILTVDECDDADGTWFSSLNSCDYGNPCRLRACCKQDDDLMFICVASQVRLDECEALDGIWSERADTCDPDPCAGGGPSAVAPASWGSIKTLFNK